MSGQTWVLTELSGQPLVADTGITATFSDDGNVGGSAGCNRYNGTYTSSGSSITFSVNMAMSLMMCEQAVMDQETAYINALGQVKTYSISGDRLSLKDASGTEILVFQAQSQDLSGSSWEAVNFNNGNQAVVGVIAGSTLTAEFGKDGTLSGNSGCNTFSGPYKVDGEKIKIGPLASTMMACSLAENLPGLAGLERKILPMLRKPWPRDVPYWKHRYKAGCQSLFFMSRPLMVKKFIDVVEGIAARRDTPIAIWEAICNPLNTTGPAIWSFISSMIRGIQPTLKKSGVYIGRPPLR